jgi:hypothetical protein
MRSTSNIRKPGTQLSSNLPTSTGLKRAVSVQPSQRFGIQSSLQQQQQQRGGLGSTVTLISQEPPVVSQAPAAVAVSLPMPKSARKAPQQNGSGATSVADKIRAVYAAAAQERPDFDNIYAKITERPIPKHNIRMDFKVR